MNQFMRSHILRGLACLMITCLMFCPYASAEVESLVKSKQTSVFGKGRFLRTDGIKIYFSGAELADTLFTYQPKRSRESRSILTNQVIRVEVERGSHALEYGLLCGFGCLIFTSLAVASSKSQASELGVEFDSNLGTSLIAAFTVGGGLIGALIGSTKKKYKTVY